MWCCSQRHEIGGKGGLSGKGYTWELFVGYQHQGADPRFISSPCSLSSEKVPRGPWHGRVLRFGDTKAFDSPFLQGLELGAQVHKDVEKLTPYNTSSEITGLELEQCSVSLVPRVWLTMLNDMYYETVHRASSFFNINLQGLTSDLQLPLEIPRTARLL